MRERDFFGFHNPLEAVATASARAFALPDAFGPVDE